MSIGNFYVLLQMRLLSVVEGTLCAAVKQFRVEDRSYGINHQTVIEFSSILLLKYA